MPTEELYGAYNFLLEIAGAKPTDSFDFTADSRAEQTALLVPAIQLPRDKDYQEASGAYRPEEGPGISADAGSDADSDVVKSAGLRSDGDLVQAVAAVDMGGDFIL